MDSTVSADTSEGTEQSVAIPTVGDVLAGLLLEERIGSGGMGEVFRAYDASLDRTVAVKVLHPEIAGLPGFRQRLIEEAAAAERVRHPNVVRVHDVRTTPAGVLLVSMHYVAGASLADLLERDGPMPLDRLVRMVGQVAGALDALHQAGTVHRDVKPANILCEDVNDVAYLADFGVAGAMRVALPQTSGTPAYMAPEQCEGRSVDGRADIYSLGCTVRSALAGRPRVASPDDRAFSDTVASPLPSDVVAVLDQATARDPAARFPTARDFADSLAECRFDAVLIAASHDADSAEAIATFGRRTGLDIAYPSAEAACEAIRISNACCVIIGSGRLGRWASVALRAAHATAREDRAFRLVAVFVDGAPDLDHAELAELAGATWVDFRGGQTTVDVLADLTHILARRGIGDSRRTAQIAECPYRGLEPFDEAHAAAFVGRESDIAELLERVREHRFLAVVGPSGSGKSSLVRAGLIPALRAGRLDGSSDWPILVIRPGTDPSSELVSASRQLRDDPLRRDFAGAIDVLHGLAGGGGRAFVVVDQFEEVFTICTDEARSSFVAQLADAATLDSGSVTVVLTLRADFYHRCIAEEALRPLLAMNQHLVGPMGPDDLRRVIEEPARAAGVRVEPGLTRRIVADVAHRPGCLPLLSHLLFELYRRGGAREMTLSAYGAAGGLDGALARRADAVIDAMDDEGAETARRVLLRLVEPGRGTEDTRRRALREELDRGWPRLDAVLERLTSERLLTRSGDGRDATIELAHEALIRSWPRLRTWVDRDREIIHAENRLLADTNDWEESGRDPALLYRGARLMVWGEWDHGSLANRSRQFLGESLTAELSLDAARRRRRTILAGIGSTALAAMTAIAVVAAWQWRQARHERDRAESQRLGVQASVLAPADPGGALRLAVSADSTAPTDESEQGMRRALEAGPPLASLRVTANGLRDELLTLAVSPDERTVAAGDDRGNVILWTWRRPGSARAIKTGSSAPVWSLGFLRGGREVAVSDKNYRLQVLDTRNGRVRPLPGSSGRFGPVATDPGGRLIVASASGPFVRVWDGLRGVVVRDIPIRGTDVTALAVSRDRSRLAVAYGDGTLEAVRLRDGQPIVRSTPDARTPGPLTAVAFDASSLRLAAVGPRLRVTADLRSSEYHRTPAADSLDAVAFLSAGRLLTGDGRRDNSIRIRSNMRGSDATSIVLAGSANTRSAVVTRDGAIVVMHQDGRIQAWRAPPPVDRRRVRGRLEWAAFGPDRRTAVLTLNDGRVITRDTSVTAPRTNRGPQRSITATSGRLAPSGEVVAALADGRFAIAPGGDRPVRRFGPAARWPAVDAVMNAEGVLVGARSDGTLLAWDTHTRRIIGRHRIPHGEVTQIAVHPFLPEVVAVVRATNGDAGGFLLVRWSWKANLGTTTLRFKSSVAEIAVSANGRTVVAVTHVPSRELVAWTWGSEQPPASVATLPTLPYSVEVDPTGRVAVVGDADGVVTVWDLRERWSVRLTKAVREGIVALAISTDTRTIAAVSRTGQTYRRQIDSLVESDALRRDVKRRLTSADQALEVSP